MKAVPLTQGYFAVVDDVDYDRVAEFRWHVKHAKRKNRYAQRMIGKFGHRKVLTLQNFILGIAGIVDHRDGDGLNNRRLNLRPCSTSQNAVNRIVSKSVNKSGFKGVHNGQGKDELSPKWTATIWLSGQSVHLGRFKTKEEAAAAYDKAAMQHFGEFARLNFPTQSNPHSARPAV